MPATMARLIPITTGTIPLTILDTIVPATMAFMVMSGGLGFTIMTTTIGITIMVGLNMDFAHMEEVDLPARAGAADFMAESADVEDVPSVAEAAVSPEVGVHMEAVIPDRVNGNPYPKTQFSLGAKQMLPQSFGIRSRLSALDSRRRRSDAFPDIS